MHKSITKIMNLDINPYQVSVYYHIYMIKSVFFGCGVIQLNVCQEKELKRLYEEPLLIKMGFSRKFPRKVLYMRKTALGIRIISPWIIIDTLKLKLFVGNKWKIGNACNSIEIQKDYQ